MTNDETIHRALCQLPDSGVRDRALAALERLRAALSKAREAMLDPAQPALTSRENLPRSSGVSTAPDRAS
jgi:hypothetical protein